MTKIDFTAIEDNFKIIKNMRPLSPEAVRRYLEEFSISASHNSNAIEGNTFTYDETRLLLKEGVTSNWRSYNEHQEIVGYKKGFDFLYFSLKNSRLITEELIKKIHSDVLLDNPTAGLYRKEEVVIGDMLNVAFTPCPANLVSDRMTEYIFSLQKDMVVNIGKMKDDKPAWQEIFNSVAKHHIEFERIHPFIDGNGRTGRLLLTYEMISLGLLPVDIRYEERSGYYAAFKNYDAKIKYSTNPNKTDKMVSLLAKSEIRSMIAWNKMFANFIIS
jgi:Fic family protein